MSSFRNKVTYLIKKETCRVFDIDPNWINTKTRKREVVNARQACHWLAYYYTKESIFNIGYFIGKKDHATVINSVKSINALVFSDVVVSNKMKGLVNWIMSCGFKLEYPLGRGGNSCMKIQGHFKQYESPTFGVMRSKTLKGKSKREKLIKERNAFLCSFDPLRQKRDQIAVCKDVDKVVALAREIAELERSLSVML